MNYLTAAKQLTLSYSRFSKLMDRRLSAHGITLTEYILLDTLQKQPQYTMRRIDLAEAIGLTASGVTRIVSPLEKIHILEKSSSTRDARVSLVKLTSAGLERHKDASTTVKYTMKEFLEELHEVDIQLFRTLAGK